MTESSTQPREMQTRYEPHGVEERWQRTWEEEGLYDAEPDPGREPFVDAHPPPNVTGELHMGHALQLAREGTSRGELGREAFEQRTWAWLEEYGGKIMHQFRRMGASLDYRRERFTMDPDYVRAVMRFFVHLYDKGWIYRDNRIINWCPHHETTLSDLELT